MRAVVRSQGVVGGQQCKRMLPRSADAQKSFLLSTGRITGTLPMLSLDWNLETA